MVEIFIGLVKPMIALVVQKLLYFQSVGEDVFVHFSLHFELLADQLVGDALVHRMLIDVLKQNSSLLAHEVVVLAVDGDKIGERSHGLVFGEVVGDFEGAFVVLLAVEAIQEDGRGDPLGSQGLLGLVGAHHKHLEIEIAAD